MYLYNMCMKFFNDFYVNFYVILLKRHPHQSGFLLSELLETYEILRYLS